MSAKTSVVLNDSLVAEVRRLAGSRSAAAAVHAALREFVRNRNGFSEGKSEEFEKKRGGEKERLSSGSWDALAALTREMRESGWDGEDCKDFRRRWGRRFDGHDFG